MTFYIKLDIYFNKIGPKKLKLGETYSTYMKQLTYFDKSRYIKISELKDKDRNDLKVPEDTLTLFIVHEIDGEKFILNLNNRKWVKDELDQNKKNVIIAEQFIL